MRHSLLRVIGRFWLTSSCRNFGSSYPAGLPEDEHHAWDGVSANKSFTDLILIPLNDQTSYRIRDWIERVRTERKTSKKNVLEERMDAFVIHSFSLSTSTDKVPFSIQERLDELGYEVSDYAAVMKEQWIKDPRPLSDRGTHFPRPPIIFNNRQTVWNNIKDKLLGKCDEKRNIREELIAAAEAAEAEKVRIADLKKILRRDREPTLQKKYRARVKVNDYHDTFVPDFSVVLETEACKELLESLDEEGYTRRTNDWLQTVSATVRDYHDRMYGHLMDCAGHALRLQLTSTKVAFTCRTCNHLGLIWPAMATHHCFVTNTEVFSRQLDQSARFYFRNRVFDLCEDRTKILGSLSAWLGYGQDAGGVDHKALIRMGDIWTLNADGPSDYREWSESWDLSEFARGVNRNQSDRVVSTLTHIAESSAGIHPLRMSWTFLVSFAFHFV